MALSLADMVKIGLRLIQNRNKVSALLEEIFAGTALSSLRDSTGLPHEYDVEWVQMALNHLLHPEVKLDVDGTMGNQTREAITLYQVRRDLTPDGWLGPVTMAQIEADIRAAHARAGRESRR